MASFGLGYAFLRCADGFI